MSIDANPSCPFTSRFAEDLKLSGKSPRTQQSYCRALRKFIEFLGQAPDQATQEQLRSYRPMRVTAQEFIPRLLQHVLPRGFQKVRHFGFLHHRSKVPRHWLAMLVTVTLGMVYTLEVGLPSSLPTRPPVPCPVCGGPLRCLGLGQRAILQLKLLPWLGGPAAIDSS